MKDHVVSASIGVFLAGLIIFTYHYYQNRLEIPTIDQIGNINGVYTLKALMNINKPFVCQFKKTDEVSEINGLIYINNQNAFAQFK